MTEDTSASKELLSQLPTNITIKSSNSTSPGESLISVNPSNTESFSSENASTVESLRSINVSATESFSSANLSSAECLRSPKPRTLSLANLPAGISVTSVACDSMKIPNVSESKDQRNAVLSTMDSFVEEVAKEESLRSINHSLAESNRSSKPKTLSINNLPPGISVSSVSCDSLKHTKSQSDDFLSAMDKFVEEDTKEEGKMQKMREDVHGDQVLDRRILNEDEVIAKADISFLASQVLKDVNHKLGRIANISISLVSESTSANKNIAKRKRYNDSDDLSIFKDKDNIEVGNKIKKISDSDNFPIIKDDNNIEIVRCLRVNSELQNYK